MKTVSRVTLRVAAVALVVVAGYFGWQWWLAEASRCQKESYLATVGSKLCRLILPPSMRSGAKVLAHEGDMVEKDQLLVRMDTLELEAALAQAQAHRPKPNKRSLSRKQSCSNARAKCRLAESMLGSFCEIAPQTSDFSGRV